MLSELGAELEFYPGVPEIFSELKLSISSNPDYQKLRIHVEQEKRIKKGNSKLPLEERSKNLHVSKNFLRQREEMEARITGEEGVLLRLCLAYNVDKLHSKIQNKRCGTYLHVPKAA